MRILCFLALFSFLFVVGCEGEQTTETDASSSDATVGGEDEDAKVDSAAELKKMLEEIAASGEGGSNLAGLRPSIEALEATKAEELLADLDKLEETEKSDEIKEIAARMAGKL